MKVYALDAKKLTAFTEVPNELLHDLHLDETATGSPVPWCSCGWQGGEHATETAAIDAWENHCDVVFMEAAR